MKTLRLSPKILNKVASCIKNGKVVVCPTDTVYGFLALAANKKAVNKIYKIKKRPRSKPLPVFVKDIKMAQDLAEITAEQQKTLKKYWPGPYTFVLSSLRGAPLASGATRQSSTVAIRIPKHKFLLALLKKIGKPLAQTSVNISGQPPLTKISAIIELCKKCGTSEVPQILIIDGGDLPKSKPSTIIDLSGEKNKILRK